ncbi:MAG TPA: antibiotic biosynthesis monooxygenase [Actinomycetota bacterium]|nr:antibiotic biosynthesis monooxygenase [Actinomycetota bacterium]
MSEPLIVMLSYSIKPGKEEEARKRIAELVDFVETNEPRMIAFHVYLDQEGKSASIVQVHPDSASMEFHMQLNAKHFATAVDWLDTSFGQQYLGPISDALAAEIAKWDEAFTHVPVHEAGFTRTSVR